MTPSEARSAMTVLIAGGSGLIGTALRRRLAAQGDHVLRLVRREPERADEVRWDPAAGELDLGAVAEADAVVNLAGASIARLPWTSAWRDELVHSRVNATRTLAAAIEEVPHRPRVFLSGSAHGWYGDRPGQRLSEEAGPGEGFLAGIAAAWEHAAAVPDGVRLVLLRTGDVLSADGGMLAVLRTLTRLGLGTRFGTGGQHWPWVSIDDVTGAIIHLLRSELHGPVNLAGPTPATADRITRGIARRLHRWRWLPSPDWGLRLLLGEGADELLLASRKLVPQRLLDDGYLFEHATVEQALDAALGPAD